MILDILIHNLILVI